MKFIRSTSCVLLPLVWPVSAMMAACELDVQSFRPDQLMAAVAIQGIANGQGAEVFLNPGQRDVFGVLTNKEVTQSAETLRKYRSVSDAWRDYYVQQKHLTFSNVPSLDVLAGKYLSELKGVVLYRANNRTELCLAATLAGLSNAIPVTSDVLAQTSSFGRLPVIADLRNRFPNKLAAYRWAIKELLPQCSREGAYSFDGELDLFALDIAVAKKLFVYDLSHLSPEVVPNAELGEKYQRLKHGLNPPEARLVPEIMAHLKPVSPVWGWGGPDEATFLFKLSESGCFVMCAQVPNISFHQQIKPFNPNLQQSHLRAVDVKLEPKHYVAFMVNEGDTMKCAASMMNYGSWLEPERGRIPINWGVSSYLCERFPGLMEYYYRTRTTNDYFFAGPGGYGYVAPQFLPTNVLFPFAEKVREGNQVADTRILEMWYFYPLQPDDLRSRWLAAMDVDGLTQWKGPGKISFSAGCPPIIDSPHYYDRASVKELAAELKQENAKAPRPWFTVVYGGDPHRFFELAKLLPPDRFKIVRLDEMFIAARQAQKLVEGRTVEAANP